MTTASRTVEHTTTGVKPILRLPWTRQARHRDTTDLGLEDPVKGLSGLAACYPVEPKGPGWRGYLRRGGGYASAFPTVDEFFGTSSQVCGGFWPFSTDLSLPVEGVPVGRLLGTGAGVCCDPISWYQAKIINQPSMFVMGLPGIGKSTFVRRLVWGLAALGVNCVIPGDLKPDYRSLVELLDGQVIGLGSSTGSINPLDPGDVHYALQRLTGDAKEELYKDYAQRREATLEVLIVISRNGARGNAGISDVEGNILSTALDELWAKSRQDTHPPVLADLMGLIRSAPQSVRQAAVWDDPDDDDKYHEAIHGLMASLNALASPHGKFGSLFSRQTTSRVDLSHPVDYDVSSLSGATDDVVAAVLAATWSSTFGAKNAADILAEQGLQPRRNNVIIMDEMHRALQASPLMVDKLDLLTRLNRQWGVGQIMITHTFADLLSLGDDARNLKARGFFERSEIKVLGALNAAEVDKFLRRESGLKVSRMEQRYLEDWSTPLGYERDSLKGMGRFLIKTGSNPGLPVDVQLCALEESGFNDTALKWHD